MNNFPIFLVLVLIVTGYLVMSVRMVNQGEQALVQRLGRYHRKLRPGLSFILFPIDRVVCTGNMRERLLDVKPQPAITRDNVALNVDAVVYWKILDLERTFYEVEDIEAAISELVVTTLRSSIGKMQFEETFSSREDINQTLLDQLDEATEPWGVKVTRVEVQSIEPPKSLLESMEKQQAAELQRRATVLEAEGEQEASVKRAKGTVDSIRLLSDVLQDRKDAREILNFLIAERYVEANQKLGASKNSKVLFMDPKSLTEGLVDLINSIPKPSTDEEEGNGKNRS